MGRGWARRAAAVATSLGLGGCLVVNGAFQAAEGDSSGTTSSTTTVVTGGAGDTSSSSEGSGGASEGSDGASAGSSSGSSGSSSSSSSSSSSDASSSGPGVDESTSTSTTGSSSTGSDACAGTEGDLCVSHTIGGQTYLLCDKHQTWEEARLACEARCARLVILDALKSGALFTELRGQMSDADKQQEADGDDQYNNKRASWWIGGHKVDGAYQWLDGTPMPPMSTGGWHPNDPNIADPDACVVLGVFGLGQNNGTWLDRSCVDVAYRAICEPL